MNREEAIRLLRGGSGCVTRWNDLQHSRSLFRQYIQRGWTGDLSNVERSCIDRGHIDLTGVTLNGDLTTQVFSTPTPNFLLTNSRKSPIFSEKRGAT